MKLTEVEELSAMRTSQRAGAQPGPVAHIMPQCPLKGLAVGVIPKIVQSLHTTAHPSQHKEKW